MQSRSIPQEPLCLLDPKAPGKKKGEGKSKSNGVATQEKGVSVVRFRMELLKYFIVASHRDTRVIIKILIGVFYCS